MCARNTNLEGKESTQLAKGGKVEINFSETLVKN